MRFTASKKNEKTLGGQSGWRRTLVDDLIFSDWVDDLVFNNEEERTDTNRREEEEGK